MCPCCAVCMNKPLLFVGCDRDFCEIPRNQIITNEKMQIMLQHVLYTQDMAQISPLSMVKGKGKRKAAVDHFSLEGGCNKARVDSGE